MHCKCSAVSFSTVTHEDERTIEDHFHRAYVASWLLRLLKNSPYFPDDVKTPDTTEAELSEGELFIGGLILHTLMVMQFNSHEVGHGFVHNISKHSKIKERVNEKN